MGNSITNRCRIEMDHSGQQAFDRSRFETELLAQQQNDCHRHRTPLGPASWVDRLVAASVFVLLSVVAVAEPDDVTVEAPDNDTAAMSESGQTDDAGELTEDPLAGAPALMDDRDSAGNTEQDTGSQMEIVNVSNEQRPSPSKRGNDTVYRSTRFDEYHWQPDCALMGKGKPQSLNLDEAKREGLIECGVCRRNPNEEDTVEIDPPTPQFLGNRQPTDDSWRIRIENSWRERVEESWRLKSQTNAAWRDGRN